MTALFDKCRCGKRPTVKKDKYGMLTAYCTFIGCDNQTAFSDYDKYDLALSWNRQTTLKRKKEK